MDRVSATPSYAPLCVKSAFSFLEGASQPAELVEAAHAHGFDALALTDRDGVHGIVRAYRRARELGLRVIVGSQVTLEDATTIVLLAKTRTGYANLCRLISAGRLRSAKGSSVVSWSELAAHAAGLCAVWGGSESLLERARDDETLAPVVELLREAFGADLHALALRHQRAEEVDTERRLRERAARWQLPLVAGNEVLYHTRSRRRLQDVVTCIRAGTSLTKAGALLKPNAEHDLKPAAKMAALFRDDPAALERTRELAQRCAFSMSEIRYRYPAQDLPNGESEASWLTKLVYAGARERFGRELPAAAVALIEKELGVIHALEYGGYFLTMHELVTFCRARDILCQGRGSAANSVVCYCLGVTAVDPVRMGLLFERFLSMERAEPPDIDLDIEHERREEVIQHVYARYGRERAAMVANVISYRARSAWNDVGKALGLPSTMLARASRLLGHCETIDKGWLENAGIDARAPLVRQLVELAAEIEGFPRHLSIHPGGFLLGHEPVTALVPIENATMEARTVVQWDKDDIETLGLFKVDLLALGSLTHLHRAFDLLRETRGLEVSMATIPPDDPPTFELISRADTVGVFQIESRAQMAMLPRLKPRNYYDLVIEVSIVRPGPITGGMVHPFLRRRRGEEEVEYPHACLKPVLEKTLGVPLFQEQVMRLAVVAADYTPGEADQLRRDMAAWKKGGKIDEHRARLVTRMQKKGIAPEFAERVFQQIKGFGEYGFPESHAASFALISYAGAWLRCHYRAEFTAALIDAQPMGFYSVATIVDDARRHGVEIRPVDVLASGVRCRMERIEPSSDARAPALRAAQHSGGTRGMGEAQRNDEAQRATREGGARATPSSPSRARFAVRMSLRQVKGLSDAEAQRIEDAARARAFTSIDDLRARACLDSRALARLAQCGALQGLRDNRRGALWEARAPVETVGAGETASLFPLDEPTPRFRALERPEEIAWDYEKSSHSTRGHPLDPWREHLRARGLPSAREVARMPHGERVHFAGLVICRQRPGTAKGITFMTLEDETGFVNLIVRENVFERHALLARTLNFLGVSGVLQSEQGVVHLLAQKLWEPKLEPGLEIELPQVPSHDFH